MIAWLARQLSPATADVPTARRDRWWIVSALAALSLTGAIWIFSYTWMAETLTFAQKLAAAVVTAAALFVILLVRNPRYIIRRAFLAACAIGLAIAASSEISIAFSDGKGAGGALSYGASWPSIILAAIVVIVLYLAHRMAETNRD